MLDATFGGFLAIASVVIGILVLTGHGDLFLRPGREDQRKNVYDRPRLEKASGILLIVFGALTGIDCFTTSPAAKIAYLAALAAAFIIFIVYIKKKCMK